MVAADDMYAYMGDGGDYLFAGQWVTGETVVSASERFAKGLQALEECVDSGDIPSLEVSDAGVDEARLFESVSDPGAEDQELLTVLYARHGGVIVLHYLLQTRQDKYSQEQRDRLTQVVLDKLTSVGRVEVLN